MSVARCDRGYFVALYSLLWLGWCLVSNDPRECSAAVPLPHVYTKQHHSLANKKLQNRTYNYRGTMHIGVLLVGAIHFSRRDVSTLARGKVLES